jgi:predicted permease
VTGVDPGFTPHGLLAMQLSLPESRYKDGAAEIRFEQELRTRLASLPGVKSVAISQSAPLFDDNSSNGFWVEGTPRPPPGQGVAAMQYMATPGFLDAMGTRLLRGRSFNEDDDLRHPVMLIDDALARKLFGSDDPIGHRIFWPPEVVGKMGSMEVVGIFGHMKQYGLDDKGPIQSGMMLPYAMGAQFAPQWFRSVMVLLRSDGDLAALSASVRREVLAQDPELPVYNVKPMESALDESLAGRRFLLLLLSLFAAAALALAAVGLYGVMSYGVVQRTKEMGIRMALGARQEDVLRLVVGGGARLAAIGIGAGVVLAAGLSRLMRGMLFGVTSWDPLTYAGLALMLGTVAVFASWLPARRASRVDPSVALRAE